MGTDTKATLVIFRKWQKSEKRYPRLGPEVFALFPLLPSEDTGYYCSSYAHVGQHCGASYYHCMGVSLPASEEESAELRAELEGLGYRLKVGLRAPHNAEEQRRATAIRRIEGRLKL